MQVKLVEIQGRQEKSQICEAILRALPAWFGIEQAIVDYVNDVQTMPFCGVMMDDNPIGFVAINDHNSSTAEIHVMGVLENHQWHGIGRQLVQWCEQHCMQTNREFLTVKTLDESRENGEYARTRLFYLSMGFIPLEVFPELWGPENPCLMLAKHLCQFSDAESESSHPNL